MQPKHNQRLLPFAKQLRRDMTPEERKLWYNFLRDYPVRFCRQKILGRYIVDFYCAQAGLVVELDGSQHFDAEGLQKDAERTAFLEKYGLKVLRIINPEIKRNFSGVCEYIDAQVQQRLMEKKR